MDELDGEFTLDKDGNIVLMSEFEKPRVIDFEKLT